VLSQAIGRARGNRGNLAVFVSAGGQLGLRNAIMSATGDKIKGAANSAVGKTKEAIGKGNRRRRNGG
jgi:hypothetical protein